MSNPLSFMKKQPSSYVDPTTGGPPADWFMDYAELTTDHAKKYMSEEDRVKMLKGYIETALKEKIKERGNERQKKNKK